MYRIATRERLTPNTFLWELEAPDVARAARAGHFIIVRIHEGSERIPLTVADTDPAAGTLTVVVQAVGKSTNEMMALSEGASVLDVIGPLGEASHIERRSKVVLVGGGLGVAPIYPQAKTHRAAGSFTISILGFRTRELVFWEDRFRRVCDEVIIATDDGTYGVRGLVSEALRQVLARTPDVEEVMAVGPLRMMQACCEVTRPSGIRTLVSLNSIMVDGTGMCGGCRVTVGGRSRFACVDGPDFDGHQVDFDELLRREKRFAREEAEAMTRYQEACKVGLSTG
ncbi:MAG TPA: sulfide/dihydroorotate dehydrogenase-like FAD/NAD-binding protein [Candidatus Sulfotelmatobacter sp.]|nr:sulfide/dihydroorotate dehydrogenase-like FAD/NAD-binding protein [Candidatus Sulfotelmatobacter sp.]